MSNTLIFTPTGSHFGFVRFSEGAPWFSNFFQFFLRKWDQEVSSDQFIWSSWWSETMTLYSPPLIVVNVMLKSLSLLWVWWVLMYQHSKFVSLSSSSVERSSQPPPCLLWWICNIYHIRSWFLLILKVFNLLRTSISYFSCKLVSVLRVFQSYCFFLGIFSFILADTELQVWHIVSLIPPY